MACFTFKHSFVGRSGSQPGTAAAHVNYISRKSATCYQEAVGIDSKPRQTAANATWRFLHERETSIRKNGRVCDKFIIAVPVEMKQDEAIGLLRRFGQRIGCRWDAEQGRLLKAPFFFTLQDWGTHNPHAHFVYIDADHESGERVFGTTKKGSTERLRQAWEETANAELERLGYEARIDRRPQRVIDAEREAQRDGPADAGVSPVVHTEGLPEDVSLPPPDAPTHQLPEQALEAQAEALPEPEPVMPRPQTLDEIRAELEALPQRAEPEPTGPARIVAGASPVSTAHKVYTARTLGQRADELRLAKTRLQLAQEWHERAEDAIGRAQDVHARTEDAQRTFDKKHRGLFGGLAGVDVFGWKSPGRRKAEVAKHVLAHEHAKYAQAHRVMTERMAMADVHAKNAAQDRVRIPGYDHMSGPQRHEALADMEKAGDAIEHSRMEAMKDVTGADIYDAYQRGELTAEEAMEACDYVGDRIYAAAIQRENEMEEGREM